MSAYHPQQIKETIRKDRGLNLGKIRIHIHLPPILDALHNEALRARKEMIEKAKREGRVRKVHCNVKLTPPWIQLIEMSDSGVKAPVSFVVEDGRLANPAETLAILALKNIAFKPYKFLSEAEKKDVPKNVTVTYMTAAAAPSASASDGSVEMRDADAH